MLVIYENTPPLKTQRLILRKFTPQDNQALFELLKDPLVNRFLPWFPIKTVKEAQAFLQDRFIDFYTQKSAYRYALCLNSNNKPIGYIWLSNTNSYNFGYGLHKTYWGQGIITEGALAVVNRIKAAGYPFITATHDVNNPASGKVMEKIGMTYRYSYQEQWQPKNLNVTFRMYQLNFNQTGKETYMGYWNQYPEHFIEEGL